MAVVFETPGLIDIRAFTTFGVNSKPNSTSPIGYFGTGLKYAISVLVREKQSVVLWIGKDKYTFYSKEEGFRDKSFSFLRMRHESLGLNGLWKKKYTELPFTTELGKNWELWMAFRELETNTRDENGKTFTLVQPDTPVAMLHDYKVDQNTYIMVGGIEFQREYDNRFKHFLDPSRTLVERSAALEVYAGSSQHVYYRGMRAYDFPENLSSRYTYNILDSINLTEDRTIALQYQISQTITKHLVQSKDPLLIRNVIESSDKWWEGKLDWDWIYNEPEDTFKEVASKSKSIGAGPSSYYSRYTEQPPKEDPWAKWPRPWTVESLMVGDEPEPSTYPVFHDANGQQVDFDGVKYALELINKGSFEV